MEINLVGWIARDKNCRLFFYKKKPVKDASKTIYIDTSIENGVLKLPKNKFRTLKPMKCTRAVITIGVEI
jgi:hypothetical protein